jgi:hypothetical protein
VGYNRQVGPGGGLVTRTASATASAAADSCTACATAMCACSLTWLQSALLGPFYSTSLASHPVLALHMVACSMLLPPSI